MAKPVRPPNAVAFIEAAMRSLEVDDQDTEFARILNLGMHGPGRVGRWRKGTSKPDYEATLTIALKCGWLNLDGEPTLRVAATERPANELAELRANQKQMLADQKQVIASLESLTASVEKLVRGIGDQPGEQQQQHD